MSHNEEQVTREEAAGAHADIPGGGLQPHPVALLQPDHRVSGCQVLTSLKNPETVHHYFVVTPEVHASSADEGGDEETELVDTGDGAREHTGRAVVVVLFIVDDLAEMDDSL